MYIWLEWDFKEVQVNFQFLSFHPLALPAIKLIPVSLSPAFKHSCSTT